MKEVCFDKIGNRYHMLELNKGQNGVSSFRVLNYGTFSSVNELTVAARFLGFNFRGLLQGFHQE